MLRKIHPAETGWMALLSGLAEERRLSPLEHDSHTREGQESRPHSGDRGRTVGGERRSSGTNVDGSQSRRGHGNSSSSDGQTGQNFLVHF